MDAPDRTPRLASDTVRGWIIFAISLPTSVVIPFAIVLLGGPTERTPLTISTLFLAWTWLGIITTALTLATFLRADASQLRRWLVATTPHTNRARLIRTLNGGGSTSWAVSGSLLAILAVAVLMFQSTLASEPLVLWSGIGVVVSSLGMTISSYAVRYAREYATKSGFEFPGKERPKFVDFLYLAVQVATTFGASDVSVLTSSARILVTVNSLISFAFNTVVVAVLVSLLVSRTG